MAGEGSRVGAEDGRWLSAREGWVAEAAVHLVLLVLVLARAAAAAAAVVWFGAGRRGRCATEARRVMTVR